MIIITKISILDVAAVLDPPLLFNLFFLKKRKITHKITLVDEDEIVIADDQLISEELNQFFQNATKALNIPKNPYLIDKSELSDPVHKALSKYKNYPSILLIKDKIRNPASFSFSKASLSDIEKGLRNLNTKKKVHFEIYRQKFSEEVKRVILKL